LLPRHFGKTTIALKLCRDRPSLYLDLESGHDRARLADLAPDDLVSWNGAQTQALRGP
jgi:hypothetical protein